MERSLKAILCPCCNKIMYTLELAAIAWHPTKDSPAVQSDQEGHYIKCRHCSRRIAMERLPDHPSGYEFGPAGNQKCDRILK